MSEATLTNGPELDPDELLDCGRASEQTRGLPIVILFELGPPPWNKLFLF